MSNSLWPHELQHAVPPCPSPTPVYSNSCPLSWWCHPAISSSAVPFSSCPWSLPASGSFPMNQLFAWGGQSTGVSASTSVLPMNTQDWWLVKTLIIGKHHVLSIKNIFEQIEWEVWYEKHIQTFAVLIATTKFSYTGALYVHCHILMNIDLQRFALLVCLPLFCLRFQRISLSFIV